MRWTRVVTVGAVTTVAAAAAFVQSCSQISSTPAAMTAEQRIARGRALSFAGGCQDCHTPGTFYGVPDTTRTLSGSELGWTGPWGTTYSRNLTPDEATGLGSWTEEQIAIAIREGRRPDNSPLLPPMPWQAFGVGFTHEEALMLAAYLKSLPPIPHQMPVVVPPGQVPAGMAIVIPPPPAWDGQNLPPPPGDGAPATGDTTTTH